MRQLLYMVTSALVLASANLSDAKEYSVVLQLPKSNDTVNLTVLENFDNTNNTKNNNKTDFFYIDFEKVGYKIFKRRIAQAMETYENFLAMDPVILKLNGTNLTRVKNETIENIEETPQDVETNTESPLKANLTKFPFNTTEGFLQANNITEYYENHTSLVIEAENKNQTYSNETLEDLVGEENKTDDGNFTLSNATKETNNTESDDVKTKPSSGFFDSLANIFQSFTNWF